MSIVLGDRDAERSVLGGMMLRPATVWDVAEQVRPEDFYEPKHEAIARVIFDLATTQRPVDPIAVGDELERRGALVGEFERPYVHEIYSGTPAAISAGYWAGIIAEKATLRRLSLAATAIAQLAGGTEGDAPELVERARAEIDAVATGSKSTLRKIGDHFADYVSVLDDKPRYIPSPWWDINNLIGGFRAGGLYVVGARPGQGKSIIGLNAAMRLSQDGPVGFCSLEMDRGDIMSRLIAQLGQVSLSQLTTHNLSATAKQQIAVVQPIVQARPLFVSTSDEVSTLAQVQAFARSVSRKASKEQPMAGLVVDYLQLMSTGKREESRQQEVANISRSLKLLAQNLGIPIIALSQLNRQGKQRSPKAAGPTLEDLRESGAIEQDADVVMLLNHDEKHKPNDLEVIVAKNRHGRTGEVTLAWEGQFSRVLSRSWQDTLLDTDEGKS